MEAGLSLGTNLGDRLAALTEAKRLIAGLPGAKILAQSPVYETEPVGVKPEYQHLQFLNSILIIETPQGIHELAARLRGIENEMGRRRQLDRFAPRPMDIDIVYFGMERIESGGLKIPHPRWAERRFVVQPLADVRPDLVIPGSPRSVAAVLEGLADPATVSLLTRDW